MTVDVRSLTVPERYMAGAGAVRISPNCRSISDRFPVLAFTVDSGGKPFCEVLLATDRALFDPVNASRRTPANFFASREHGLLRAGSEAAVYHVPSSVLQSFAGASAIFYTAVAYDTEQATNPTYAQPPEVLAREAPSVDVAPDFRGRTMASVLSVPVDKLLRVRDDCPAVETATSPLVADSYALDADAADDRLDAEDGYGETAAILGEEPLSLSHHHDVDTFAAPNDDYTDGFEDAPAPEEVPAPEAYAPAYGDESEWVDGGSEAQESVFPAGAEPPALLEDEDEEDRYGLEDAAAAYDRDYEDVPAEVLESAAVELTPRDQVRILQFIASSFESTRNGYSEINADGEFRGVFANHPAIGKWHVGLSWGFIQFTQDSGSLGEVLVAMRERDRAKFDEIFGADADELIRVTTARGPSSRKTPPRGVRVQPVGGADLWEEPWLSRFRSAGAHAAFQAAQNEAAARIYITPVRPFARSLGLDSQRALAMVVDRSIHQGPPGAQRWIIDAVSPIATEAHFTSALRSLGHADLRSFQRSAGVTADGVWGPKTHTALFAALRALAAGQSPIPIPTREQMLDAMVRTAQSEERRWTRRLVTLRETTELSDEITYAL